MTNTALVEILEEVQHRLALDELDTKGLTVSQIQSAIDDYLSEQIRNRYRREERQRDEARKEARRKMSAQRLAIRRLLEKGGISIANADDYRSSLSSLDLTPDAEGFYRINLNAGGWSIRRPSPEQADKVADNRRRMIAQLHRVAGIEVKIDTQVKKSNWKGEEEEYLVISYLVRKAQTMSQGLKDTLAQEVSA